MHMLRRIATVATAALVMAAPGLAWADDGPSWVRLSGADRYGTMASAVEAGQWNPGRAVLATGQSFPDALAASALAGTFGCPVVLTSSASLSQEASTELARLGVGTVYLMGGESSLSEAVERQLWDQGYATYRVSGPDRTATSLAALSAARAAGSTSGTVVIASGTNYADALSIGSWAYATGSPVMLTGPDGMLTSEAVSAVRSDPYVRSVLIVGGPMAVSGAVRDQLGDSYSYQRLSGEDRYQTSRDVAEWSASHGLAWDVPVVATGRDFPDALAGTALAGSNGSVLVLANMGTEPTVTMLAEHRDQIWYGYLLGGRSSVSFDSPTSSMGQSRANANAAQLAIVAAAAKTPSPGYGLCAKWVQDVYVAAGYEQAYGDACNLYRNYCTSENPNDLKVGMIVAVDKHQNSELGGQYGHVGIYVGDGLVMDNVGDVRTITLSSWIDYYGGLSRPRWGWLCEGAVA